MDYLRIHARKILAMVISIGLLGLVLYQVDLSEIATGYSDLSLPVLLILFALIAGNMVLVTVRLYLQIRTAGFEIPFVVAIRANAAGLLSSLVVINLLGTMAGRFYTLRRYGIDPATVAAITAIERLLLVIVAGSLFVAGSVMLFGFSEFSTLLQKSNLLSISGVVALVMTILLFLLKDQKERDLLSRFMNRSVLSSGTVLFLLTLLTQLLMLFVYLAASKGVGVEASNLEIIAAAAIISFAASMPISVNGWGVREVASVYALGHLGVDPATAVSISVLVGLCATIMVLLNGLFLVPGALKSGAASPAESEKEHETDDQPTIIPPDVSSGPMLWISLAAGTLVAILIFFQVHTQFGTTLLNVNLADPLAVLGLLSTALMLLQSRSLVFTVGVSVSLWLAGLTTMILLGFLHGYYLYGVLDWALTNRLVGWFILLGYFCIGAAYARKFGDHGLQRLVQVMIVTVSTIVVFWVIKKGYYLSVGKLQEMPTNLEGFAFNRNAFCFQLLISLAGAIAFSRTLSQSAAGKLWHLLVGIILFGIWATQSRTGLAIATLLLTIGLFLPQLDRQFVIKCLLISITIGIGVEYLPDIIIWLTTIITGNPADAIVINPITINNFAESGLTERWMSITEGLQIWRENLLIGGGLGAFVAKGIESGGGGILVIHSTPVWILAEFGIIGAAIVLSLPVIHVHRLYKSGFRALSTPTLYLMNCVIVFAAFGVLHDMAYQRAFWFVFGAAAAAIALNRKQLTRG